MPLDLLNLTQFRKQLELNAITILTPTQIKSTAEFIGFLKRNPMHSIPEYIELFENIQEK